LFFIDGVKDNKKKTKEIIKDLISKIFFKYVIKKKIIRISEKQLLQVASQIGSDVVLGLNPINTILSSKNKLKLKRFKNCKKLYTLVVKLYN